MVVGGWIATVNKDGLCIILKILGLYVIIIKIKIRIEKKVKTTFIK